MLYPLSYGGGDGQRGGENPPQVVAIVGYRLSRGEYGRP